MLSSGVFADRLDLSRIKTFPKLLEGRDPKRFSHQVYMKYVPGTFVSRALETGSFPGSPLHLEKRERALGTRSRHLPQGFKFHINIISVI